MLVSIVIVNFNAGKLISACIESIIQETIIEKYEIIVVDNDSSDESVEAIKKKFPFVKIIETGVNLGFAAGNNIGFNVAKGDFILVLNPDTLIIDKAIDKAVAYLSNHPEVGILGCKVLSKTGERLPTLMRFFTLTGILINTLIPIRIMCKSRYLGRSHYPDIDYSIEHDVDVVVGCFMMLPQGIIHEIGGFDEDFFMFVEDVEWCWRIVQAGKKVRYYPESTIIHYGGGCSSSLAYRKVLFIAKGTLIFFKKTQGPFIAMLANLFMLLRDAPKALLWIFFQLLTGKRVDKGHIFKKFYIRLIYLFLYLLGIEQKI